MNDHYDNHDFDGLTFAEIYEIIDKELEDLRKQVEEFLKVLYE